MAKMCAECASFLPDHRKNCWSKDCWCDKLDKWVDPESTECYREYNYFCEAYNRSSREIDNAIRGISDGCFIVTMACNLLGREPKSDKCLQTFTKFKRDLIKEGKCTDFLILYESLGPAIAHRIRTQGESSTKIAKNLYYVYFPEILKDIYEGKKDKAFIKYVDLVKVLADGCGFSIKKRETEPAKVYTMKY